MKSTMKVLVLFLVLSCPASCLDLFEISQAAFVGANVGDVASSWGKFEANPLWPGRVGTRHALIKVGVVAALLIVERKFKGELKREFTVLNFALAASLTGVSVRNFHQGK